MFYLRLIYQDNTEGNISLGESYTYTSKDTSPEEFERISNSLDMGANIEGAYAFISSPKNQLPLYRKNKGAFIMTENGKTYANVSR